MAKKNMMLNMITMWLLIIGGLIWGLVAVGYFFGINLNLVNLVLGRFPVIENLVYLIVGGSALSTAIMNKK